MNNLRVVLANRIKSRIADSQDRYFTISGGSYKHGIVPLAVEDHTNFALIHRIATPMTSTADESHPLSPFP